MATLRKLKPEEIAVIDAIITQRVDSESDVFEYDFKKTRDYLSKNGASKKHMMTPNIQRQIVWDLSADHIIDMDSIVNTEFINNYRLVQDPNYVPDDTVPPYYWLNHTDWAYEHFQLGGRISIEEAYDSEGSAMYIRMTIDEATELRNKYIDDHKVQLRLSTDSHRLYIKIDDNQDWNSLPTLHSDTVPYKVIECAWRYPGKTISLKQMLKAKIIDEATSKGYMSAIFLKNRTVKALHPKLIELDTNSITLRKSAVYTYDELYDLRVALKI